MCVRGWRRLRFGRYEGPRTVPTVPYCSGQLSRARHPATALAVPLTDPLSLPVQRLSETIVR